MQPCGELSTTQRFENARSCTRGGAVIPVRVRTTSPSRSTAMRTRFLSLHALLVVALATLLSSAAQAVQPLRVSGNDRMLVQQNGAPFFWMGDTNWRLYKLTREEIDQYLDNRKAKKFNVIQGPVLVTNSTDIDFTNAYGENNTDPANPNEAWFDHIDYIVN